MWMGKNRPSLFMQLYTLLFVSAHQVFYIFILLNFMKPFFMYFHIGPNTIQLLTNLQLVE